ncbi:aquaporin-10 isoform X3 [Cuculus canorus]|uniref:aquaporin-10 isoform X3 n=1 Tax=Cuculus canorus TaxID=55661 RepID=UPI0023AA4B36|nr:aquaporin-10 isoform X3 [Cuculus canorus]
MWCHCPQPHVGLWSLPGVSLSCGLDWIKVCVLSPTPAPGFIKSHCVRADNAGGCLCCPFLSGTMATNSILKKTRALLRIRNQLARECLAELLAVFVLILITLGGSAQMLTSSGTKGNILTANLAGALAVMVAIYTAGGVSGAHLNPAFSLAMCLVEQLPWWKFPIFVTVQTLAAFISAGAVYALYSDAIQHYSNGTLTVSGPRETASIFATYPADYLSISNGFLDQVMGTAVLILGIQAIVDTQNKGIPKGLEPVAVALLVFSIEVSMGSNCGCPMNPARDFGPRLFTYVGGWGAEVFSSSWLSTTLRRRTSPRTRTTLWSSSALPSHQTSRGHPWRKTPRGFWPRRCDTRDPQPPQSLPAH